MPTSDRPPETRARTAPADACYTQTLPSGDHTCIRESHTDRPCRHLPPPNPKENQ